MGYFLEKTWLWWLLAILLAVLITWLIFRRWNRQAPAGDGSAELTRLRGAAETHELELRELRSARDDAQQQLAASQAAHDDCRQQLAAAQVDALELASAQAPGTAPATAAAPAAETVPVPATVAASAPAATVPATEAVPDLDAGAAALGHRVTLDRLEEIEGIGPKIAGLLHEAGVNTWRELSATPVPRLVEVLRAAGPRYQFHDPGTWPRQAELLANGKWAEFKQWSAQLRGGRETS